jgi:L-threonylcarbamoyladenylate synthase
MHGVPTLLRPGTITKAQLEEVLQREVALPEGGQPVPCPGMKYRHYAPRAQIRIVDQLPKNAQFILSRDLGTLNARSFYTRLREGDRQGFDTIWILLDPISRRDEGLMNRLFRAAGIL